MEGRLGNSQIKQRLGLRPFNYSHKPFQKQDARMKLIEKKRLGMTDARDRLAQIAKQEDARVRINKLKNMKSVQMKFQETGRFDQGGVKRPPPLMMMPKLNQIVVNNGNAGTIKKTITRTSGPKTMTRMKAGALMRTVNGSMKPATKPVFASVKKLPPPSSDFMASRYHPLPSNPNVVTIRNEKAVPLHKEKSIVRSSPQLKAKRPFRPATSSAPSLGPRRALSDIPLTRTFRGSVWEPDMAPASLAPPRQEMKPPARLKITTANNYIDYDTPYAGQHESRPFPPPRAPAIKRPSYDAYDDYGPSPPKKQTVLSSSIVSRLDQPRRPIHPTHPGYKVMVTNLHHNVSVEDVEELFRNIGSIRHARILREGIAEVIFMNEEDAYSSVDVYHNRQLDGQAMNVTVVSKKSSAGPVNSNSSAHDLSAGRSSLHGRYSPPSQYPLRKANIGGGGAGGQSSKNLHPATKSVLRTAGGSESAYNSSLSALAMKHSPKVDVAPDINAIHHALFSGKASNTNSNLQVYIKLPRPPLRGGK